MYKTLIKIYGTHKRDHFIKNMQKALNVPDENVVYDDRPNGGGPLYTCEKCWRSCENTDADFVICLQDDVELPDNFFEIVEKIQNAQPDKVVALFPCIYEVADCEFTKETAYYATDFIAGVGIMMPTKYIKPCFDYIDAKIAPKDPNIQDDVAMQLAFDRLNIKKIYTIPSVIQHIGDDSLINQQLGIRRAASYKSHCEGAFDSNKVISLVDQIVSGMWEYKKVIKK